MNFDYIVNWNSTLVWLPCYSCPKKSMLTSFIALMAYFREELVLIKRGSTIKRCLELHAQRERVCARTWPLGVQFTVEMQFLIVDIDVDVDDGKIMQR